MKGIALSQDKVAIVDDLDFPYLSQFKWTALKGRNTWYAVRNVVIDGRTKMLLMHRLLLDAPTGLGVDHRDGDGLNNQRANLRLCNEQQNGQNRTLQSNNKSGYKGVSWDKRKRKWTARIKAHGKQPHLGYFDTAKDAARAYDAAALELHGEFARLNFNQQRSNGL